MLVQNGTANEEDTFTKKQSTQTYEASCKTKRIPLVRMYGIGWNKATALTIPVIERDFTHTIEMLTMELAGGKMKKDPKVTNQNMETQHHPLNGE